MKSYFEAMKQLNPKQLQKIMRKIDHSDTKR